MPRTPPASLALLDVQFPPALQWSRRVPGSHDHVTYSTKPHIAVLVASDATTSCHALRHQPWVNAVNLSAGVEATPERVLTLRLIRNSCPAFFCSGARTSRHRPHLDLVTLRVVFGRGRNRCLRAQARRPVRQYVLSIVRSSQPTSRNTIELHFGFCFRDLGA